MKLLFLDTETSGVDSHKDQIIEIGAIVFELENNELRLIDYFQTTISLRKILDERITRITGITEAELATAPGLIKAQTMYNNWIEKYEGAIVGIVGHSVDFDIGFLKKEGWQLPSKNYYDTLNLAKVLLPQMQAVNLEFLSKKIGFGETLRGIPNEGLSYHRALYDSIMCANLFEFCIKQINLLGCSQLFADQFCQLFLPNGISFYKPHLLEIRKNHHTEDNFIEEVTQVEFTGKERVITVNDKIKNLHYSHELESTLLWNLPREFQMVALQLYIIANKNQDSSNFFLKLHSLGIGFWWANFILELLLPHTIHSQKTLFFPENIIDKINLIADLSINFDTITTYLEILEKVLLHNDQPDQNIINWLSQYEFFLITFQPFLNNYEYKINFAVPTPQEKNVAQKFILLIDNLKKLALPNIKNLAAYPALQLLENKIIEFISQINFDPNSIYVFKNTGSKNLFVSKYNQSFDLAAHFDNLYKGVGHITTNLNQNDYQQLLDLGNITVDYKRINFAQNYDYQSFDNISRVEFLNDQIEKAKSSGRPIFVICGQNSSLKNLAKTATDFDLMDNILIIGESGGVTKIASKIDQGFVGVVIFKFSSVDYFYNLYKTPELYKIILYDRPYFHINEYWYNRSKLSKKFSPDSFLKDLKDIYLQSKVNSLNQKFNCPIQIYYNLY
jgi:DNA polymerase III epsilon subunit-like protein